MCHPRIWDLDGPQSYRDTIGNFREEFEQRVLNVRNIFRIKTRLCWEYVFTLLCLCVCVGLKNKYEFFKSDENFSIAFYAFSRSVLLEQRHLYQQSSNDNGRG